MRLEDLRERIKDEVILREGEIRDHEWRQIGLVDETTKLGLSESDFGRLVQDESRKVDPYLSRISLLKIKIKEAAELSNRRLTEEEIKQFVGEAERLQLSRAFVEEKWIPQIISTIPLEALKNTPFEAIQPVRPIRPVTSTSKKKPVTHLVKVKPEPKQIPTSEDFQEPIEKTLEERKVISDFVKASSPKRFVNPQRPKRPTNSFESSVPSGNLILNQAHNLIQDYAATRTVSTILKLFKGSVADVELWHKTLDKSIRWTGMFLVAVWKVFMFVLKIIFDIIVWVGRLLGNPEFWRTTGVIVRVAIVASIIWFGWSWLSDKISRTTSSKGSKVAVASSKSSRKSPYNKKSNHRASEVITAGNNELLSQSKEQVVGDDSITFEASTLNHNLSAESANQPERTEVIVEQEAAFKPYDDIFHKEGYFHEREASKNGKWGLWVNDHWFIEPKYDEIDLFENNLATTVLLNGQKFKIDPQGNRLPD